MKAADLAFDIFQRADGQIGSSEAYSDCNFMKLSSGMSEMGCMIQCPLFRRHSLN